MAHQAMTHCVTHRYDRLDGSGLERSGIEGIWASKAVGMDCFGGGKDAYLRDVVSVELRALIADVASRGGYPSEDDTEETS